ncbi:hypothetical protein AAC387_Pa06g0876 [Persea americana]
MFQAQLGKTVEVYIDDMVVKSRRSHDHLADLSQIFDILRQFQLKLNASKCAFGVGSDKFLESLVTRRGIEANPDQITAIQELRSLTSTTQTSLWTSLWNSPLRVRHRPCSTSNWGGNKDTEAVTEKEQEQSWKKFLDSAWKVFVYGSSTSKRAGAGIVLQSPEGLVIEQALTLSFKASNNKAEYEALIAEPNSVKILEAWHVMVFSDSQLVTSQISGDYQARDDRMAAYLAQAKELPS